MWKSELDMQTSIVRNLNELRPWITDINLVKVSRTPPLNTHQLNHTVSSSESGLVNILQQEMTPKSNHQALHQSKSNVTAAWFEYLGELCEGTEKPEDVPAVTVHLTKSVEQMVTTGQQVTQRM